MSHFLADYGLWLLIALLIVIVVMFLLTGKKRTGALPPQPVEPPAKKAEEAKAAALVEPNPIVPEPILDPIGLAGGAIPLMVTPDTAVLAAAEPEPAPAPKKAAAPKKPVAPKAAPVAKAAPKAKPAAAPALKATPAKAKAAPAEPAVPVAAPAPPEAKTPPAAKTPPKPKAAPKAAAVPDDLLLLKGVGPKLNILLGDLGVTSFAQIAAWKKADLAAIDEKLGTFKGRPERDDWIDQAKLLAKGDVAGFEAKYGKL